MKIFTVIVTYNAMRWIDKCLGSLGAGTVQTQVVVVDNCSTDGTASHVPSHYPHVVWLPQSRNLGFGQGNNVGIRYALGHGADHVFLLNQDAYVASDTVERLLGAADGQSLIVPVQLNGDGTRLDYMFGRALKSASQQLFYDLLNNNSSTATYPVGETGAACWFMPRSMFEEIGGFNPLFFQYSEDNNYYQRIIAHGRHSLLVPRAFVRHDRRQFGNIQAYNRNRIRRDMLIAVCDVNRPLLVGLLGALRVLARCYVYELPRRQYRPGTYLAAAVYVATHFGRILASRRKEKSVNATWL